MNCQHPIAPSSDILRQRVLCNKASSRGRLIGRNRFCAISCNCTKQFCAISSYCTKRGLCKKASLLKKKDWTVNTHLTMSMDEVQPKRFHLKRCDHEEESIVSVKRCSKDSSISTTLHWLVHMDVLLTIDKSRIIRLVLTLSISMNKMICCQFWSLNLNRATSEKGKPNKTTLLDSVKTTLESQLHFRHQKWWGLFT